MDKKEGYEHYFPEVPEDVTAFSKLKKRTVESIEELKNIIKENEEKSFVAWDTETTGLNYEVDRIVGFSFAFSSKEGWYVPIRHVLGNNLPVKESLDIFYEMLCSKKMCFEYNMRFDTRMMLYEGYDMTKVLYYDVQVGVYMADTNWKKTGLKGAERRWLGWGADTFEETVGEATNFAYTDPRDSGQYAAQDAIGTFAVAEKTIKYYKESKLSGRIVNELLYHLMLCEDTKLDIDVDYLEKCYSEALEHLKSLEHQIMSMVGYTFKINSNKQLGDALQSIGINTGYFTKGGSMKVDIQSLENTNLKNPHPVLGLLVEYSKLFKEINSYYEPMLKEGKKHPKQVRFNFKHCVAPTMRIAAGGDRKNPYFAPLNIMAIPKPHPKMWYVHNWNGEEVPEGDVAFIKWRFSLTDKSPWLTEGFDPVENPRYAIRPSKENRLVVGMDYCQDPETLISTPKGKVRIKDLKNGDLVNTPEGPRKCINPHYTGKKKVVEIKTTSGSILRVSSEHRIVVQRGSKQEVIKVSELRRADKVVEEWE